MTDRGVIVFGKVEQGYVEVGTRITIAPSLKTAQVLSIFNSKEELVKYAKPGENVKLRLGGLADESEIRKGDVICPRDDTLPITEIFIAEIKVLQLLEHKPIMSQGYKSILHIHTIQQQCDLKEIDIEFIEGEKGQKTQKLKPKFVSSGAVIQAKIAIDKAICIEKFETLASMGRFTLRDEGKTIAIGKILKYKPA